MVGICLPVEIMRPTKSDLIKDDLMIMELIFQGVEGVASNEVRRYFS